MSTVTGIQSGSASPLTAAVEPREAPVAGTAAAAHSSSSPQVENTSPRAPDVPAPTSREEIETAVEELRAAMRTLPGAEREVLLLFEPEDRSYLIEVRNKETGALLQTFPPENLLNLRRRSADLLGVLIDRRS
jgi:uncharacterized FlaG/YvyC family protein